MEAETLFWKPSFPYRKMLSQETDNRTIRIEILCSAGGSGAQAQFALCPLSWESEFNNEYESWESAAPLSASSLLADDSWLHSSASLRSSQSCLLDIGNSTPSWISSSLSSLSFSRSYTWLLNVGAPQSNVWLQCLLPSQLLYRGGEPGYIIEGQSDY